LSHRKTAKEEAKGILPARARPLAMLTMSASAMPQVKKRSGKSLAKVALKVDLARSASRATTLGLERPSSASACP
jgi:hypothetical protein